MQSEVRDLQKLVIKSKFTIKEFSLEHILFFCFKLYMLFWLHLRVYHLNTVWFEQQLTIDTSLRVATCCVSAIRNSNPGRCIRNVSDILLVSLII